MKIRFLKDCKAPQQYTHHCSDGCCSWEVWEGAYFVPGEEADPEEYRHKIDLSGLKYKEDFEILEYP